jgi:hypothetical protein
MLKEQVQYIVVHHTYTTRGNAETLRKFHVQDKGWSDVGEHYIICNGNGGGDGEIQNGRSIDIAGSHARGMNTKSIGVVLVGDFDHYFPSQNQWAATVSLIRKLMMEFNVPADNVIGHREVYVLLGQEPKKSCPGWKLDMDRLRRDVSGMPGGEFFGDGRLKGDEIMAKVNGRPTEVDVRLICGRPMIAIKDLTLVVPGLRVNWGGSPRSVEIDFVKREEVKVERPVAVIVDKQTVFDTQKHDENVGEFKMSETDENAVEAAENI